MTRVFLLSAIALFASVAVAAAQLLPAFKDRLYAYPVVLAAEDGGDYLVVEYLADRDINERDLEPERRVNGKYISTRVRRAQHDLVAETPAGRVPHIAVGKSRRASIIVMYVHGQGGNRRQGASDLTFGGNFNRIKNMVNDAGGLYLSPDFSDFGQQGTAELKALLDIYMRASPTAKVYVACGSMGGAHCWRLARDPAMASRLGGLIMLGSMWDDGFFDSPAFEFGVPVFFGHGSRDGVFPIDTVKAFYRKVREVAPGYPIRMVRFEDGSHGLPIRMTDWRETINWMHKSAGR